MRHRLTNSMLLQRRFGYLFWCQVTGALNDHLLKNVIVLLATFYSALYTGVSLEIVTTVAAATFVFPFVIFSATAGQIADKYDKAMVIRIIKCIEVGTMSVASAGVLLQSLPLLLVALAFLGVHAAFFGPLKYSVMPRVLKEHELVKGNALTEMGTFLAILCGTVGAEMLVGHRHGTLALAILMPLLALAGAVCAWRVPRTGSADPKTLITFHPIRQTVESLRVALESTPAALSIVGIAWFYFYGSLLVAQLVPYAQLVLGGDHTVIAVLLAIFALGVGLGSLLCEYLSDKRLEIGLVPFGSIGLSVFAIDLWWSSPAAPIHRLTAQMVLDGAHGYRFLADLALIGVFGAFYVVPLYALLQTRTAPTHQSRVIAASNIVNAVGVIIGAGFTALLVQSGMTVPQLILACGIFNAFLAGYIYTLVPAFSWRFIAWIMVNLVYRVEKRGLHHIPDRGPAILVGNHVSFADAPVLSAVIRRPMRFIMYYAIFNVPVLNLVFRGMKAIPIAEMKKDPVTLARAFDEVDAALRRGELVFVFPEGQLSKDGTMREFKRGIERILERTPVQVVPIGISGLWESVWSRNPAPKWPRLMRALPFRKLVIAAGPAVPPEEATAERLYQLVDELRVPGLP